MKKHQLFFIFIIGIFLIGCVPAPQNVLSEFLIIEQSTPVPDLEEIDTKTPAKKDTSSDQAETIEPQPTLTPTPDPFFDFYGCVMTIEFISGPLEGQISEFSILDRSYFEDKGDKFAVGKGTAIYYEETPYLILHYSYVNGNILKPMEAEFIRKYLEHWGNKGEEYIQQQMDQLMGSEIKWICEDEHTLTTTISSIVRLSHEASDRLWLEPENIGKILLEREGPRSEWIGKMRPSAETSLYLGFCGWGPASLESGRYTYFRYVIRMSVQDH